MSIYPNDPDKQRMVHIVWISLVLAIACMAVVFGWTGCAPQEQGKQPVSTGKVIANFSFPIKGHIADAAYAEFNSASIPAIHANFKKVLFDQGLVKWDSRYDCNHFASLWIALANTKFAVQSWHSYTSAQSLSLAEVWYRPDSKPKSGHAIVGAFTERGMVYIEPQTGLEVILSPTERSSIYFVKW